MIRFMLMSSNKKNIEECINKIDQLLMDNNIHYETHVFTNFDKTFDDFCKNGQGSNVFIIENENSMDILSVINKIRNVYKMYASFIIIIDNNNKINRYDILDKYSFMCDLIQTDNICKRLTSDLKYILNVIYDRKKVLTFNYERALYKIPFKDILYIEKELNGKRCMIICKHKVYTTYKSLIEIEKGLDERFIKSHQSALINYENVKEIDFLNNKILFDYKNECNLLSRNMKKKLKEHVLNK